MNFTSGYARRVCFCVVLLTTTSRVVGQEVSTSESVRAEGSAADVPATFPTGAEGSKSSTGSPGSVGVPALGFGSSSGTLGVLGRSKPDISYPYSYTVSLRRRSDLGYFCAGVLVGNRHVLTAAHCVDSSTTSTDSRPQVVVGSIFSTKTSGPGVQVISTQNVFIHPDYKSRGYPDLAILELSSAANQAPLKIPTSTSFRPQNGNLLSSIGWGRKRRDSGYSEIAQVVEVDFISRLRCRRILFRQLMTRQFVRSHQICMGGDGVGSCPGDDGGPIILPGDTVTTQVSVSPVDILVGIVGSSHVCGGSPKPDVHTNIAPFIDWIKSTAGLP
ncbi:hypothetical protein BSKO_13434 [Bryopsis sp. KO-2023]|nr:hypothetical protein BSKO_13432 [Bryopsis sp. KO-2023]GMH45477.1 hypothetical protein BSKO_13434 [Bryopsis sp. KO-2023]